LIGLSVGSLQIAVNQGDLWWSGAVDARVMVKTALTPLITGSVAVFSAAWAAVKKRRGEPEEYATLVAVHDRER
jgi:hypothetical protein